MKIAAAQTYPIDGDIDANIHDHCRLAELAAENGAGLILFPEMSLTGYTREKAMALSFSMNDERLSPLRRTAEQYNITIIAGAPVRYGQDLYIGAFIISPDAPVTLYTKQFLHEGEEKFFSGCEHFNPVLQLAGENISLAICADITHPLHAENAAGKKTSLYLASIFYTPNGITRGFEDLKKYAEQHAMCVLMSNYGGPSWNLAPGGSSAFWDNAGKLIGKLENTDEGLLIAEKEQDNWTIKKLLIN